MGELETEPDALEHFVSSQRAGRRNALPEIEVEIDDPGASKLADRLSDMSSRCDSQEPPRNDQPSTSQVVQTTTS